MENDTFDIVEYLSALEKQFNKYDESVKWTFRVDTRFVTLEPDGTAVIDVNAYRKEFFHNFFSRRNRFKRYLKAMV